MLHIDKRATATVIDLTGVRKLRTQHGPVGHAIPLAGDSFGWVAKHIKSDRDEYAQRVDLNGPDSLDELCELKGTIFRIWRSSNVRQAVNESLNDAEARAPRFGGSRVRVASTKQSARRPKATPVADRRRGAEPPPSRFAGKGKTVGSIADDRSEAKPGNEWARQRPRCCRVGCPCPRSGTAATAAEGGASFDSANMACRHISNRACPSSARSARDCNAEQQAALRRRLLVRWRTSKRVEQATNNTCESLTNGDAQW